MDPDYRSGLAGASKELGRTGYYFVLAFSLTFIFMYIVLAAQFESFIHPITILLTLPLAVPFGILSLLLAGPDGQHLLRPRPAAAVRHREEERDSADRSHQRPARQRLNRYDAIIQANRDRLRPILMTTIALVAGMVPLVISRGAGVGHQPLDRRAGGRRTVALPAADAARRAGVLLAVRRPRRFLLHRPRRAPLRLGRPALQEGRGGLHRPGRFADLAVRHRQLSLPDRPPVHVTARGSERGRSVQPRIGIAGQAPLRLPEVIERVLANDPDLAISRIQLRRGRLLDPQRAGRLTIPSSACAPTARTAVTPVASLIGGTASGKLTLPDLNVTPQLSGITPAGGTYSLNFTNARQTTDSTFNTLNPQYPTALSLNLTQPLWRGLRFDENRHRLQVARKNQQLSAQQLRQRVIEVVTQAIQAYWELDYAYNNFDVQTEAVQARRAPVRKQPAAGRAGHPRARRRGGRADPGRPPFSRTCSPRSRS